MSSTACALWPISIFLCISPLVFSLPATNSSTLVLPPGLSNHGDPKLICTRSTGWTVLLFLLRNYATHAATTQALPGEVLSIQILVSLTAFLLPGAGVYRGINQIARGILVMRRVIARADDLDIASAAGALCMIVRDEGWAPVAGYGVPGVTKHPPRDVRGGFYPNPMHQILGVLGVLRGRPLQRIAPPVGSITLDGAPTNDHSDTIHDALSYRIYKPDWLDSHRFLLVWRINDVSAMVGTNRQIHGIHPQLPRGYTYAIVPPDAIITPSQPISDDGPAPIVQLAASRNTAKVVIALVQTIYASYTLYETRGDQIRRYGYASFGLTVAPYAVMSVVNLIGSLLVPVYPSLFLVRSEVMDEVECIDGQRKFEGTVGVLGLPDVQSERWFFDTEPGSADNDGMADQNDRPGTQPRGPTSTFARLGREDKKDFAVSIPACSISLPAVQRQSLMALFTDLYLTVAEVDLALGVSVALGLPLAILGGISHFDEGESTRAQRGWVMGWLVVGAVYGVGFWRQVFRSGQEIYSSFGQRAGLMLAKAQVGPLVMLAPLAVASIGGFVVVSQMILEYGDCTLF